MGGARRQEALAQIKPPGEREARRIEREVDAERERRAAGRGDRGAEAARNEVAATGADRADEAERGAAGDACRLERTGAGGLARALGLAQLLLAEDRRDHPIGRAVADAGGDEQHEEHGEKAVEALYVDEVHDADGG